MNFRLLVPALLAWAGNVGCEGLTDESSAVNGIKNIAIVGRFIKPLEGIV